LNVTQGLCLQALGNSRFIHFSHERRELALSLVLHEWDERYACNLLLHVSLKESRSSAAMNLYTLETTTPFLTGQKNSRKWQALW
jgi:hypothetical protein